MSLSIHPSIHPSIYPPIHQPQIYLSDPISSLSALSYLVFSYPILFYLFSSTFLPCPSPSCPMYKHVCIYIYTYVFIYLFKKIYTLPYPIEFCTVYRILSPLISSYLIYGILLPWRAGSFFARRFFVCPSQVVTPAAAPGDGSRSLEQWAPRNQNSHSGRSKHPKPTEPKNKQVDLASEILKLSFLSSSVLSCTTCIPS